MKKIFLFIVLILLFCAGNGQVQRWKLKRVELTGGISMAQFFGDFGIYGDRKLNPYTKGFTPVQAGPEISIGTRYRIQNNIAGRLNIASGYVHSKEFSNSAGNTFSSSTIFIEPTVTAEYYLLKNKSEKNYLLDAGRLDFFSMIDLYLFTGIGGIGFSVSPNKYLAPFISQKTGFAPVLPAGAGMSFFSNHTYQFGLEFGSRYVLSNILNGYHSTFSTANDFYYFMNLTMVYKFRTGKNMHQIL